MNIKNKIELNIKNADSDNMDCGIVTQIYTLKTILSTQSVLVIIKEIGSLHMSPGT